jgi:hypothetical protein
MKGLIALSERFLVSAQVNRLKIEGKTDGPKAHVLQPAVFQLCLDKAPFRLSAF